MVRHDQVRIAGEPELAGVDLLRLEHLELVEQHRGIDHHAVADHRDDPRVEHAARHELELEDLAVDDQGVARVVAALVADAHRRFLGEVVGDAALALIAPLGADDHHTGHCQLRSGQLRSGVLRVTAASGLTLGTWYSTGLGRPSAP